MSMGRVAQWTMFIVFGFTTYFTGIQVEAKSRPHPLLSRYAIDDLEGVFAWRDLRFGRRFLNTVLSHAPKMSRFEEAKKQLNKIDWSGFKPFLGQSQGLDPLRGIYLLWNKDQKRRLLITHQAGKAREALHEASAMITLGQHLDWQLVLEDEIQASPNVQDSQPPSKQKKPQVSSTQTGVKFTCQRQKELLLCDSHPFTQAPAPYWLTSDLDRGAVWGIFRKPTWLPRPFLTPWEHLEFHLDLNGEELNLSFNLGARMNYLLSLLSPQEGLSPLIQWIHEDSPLALNLSLNPEVLRNAGLFAERLPWLKEARRWLDKGWNGEALLTFDGGFDHPVLLLSLNPQAWSGEQLNDYLSKRLGFGIESTLDETFQYGPKLPLIWWTIPNSHGDPWLIPTLIHNNTLMIALFPADLKRRTHDAFTPNLSPSVLALEKQGMSGGMIDPSIFELNQMTGGRINPSTLIAVLIRIAQEGGSGLIDVPKPLRGEEGSLAEALSRLSRFEYEKLVQLLSPIAKDEASFIAWSDLSSLLLQLTEHINVLFHSYHQADTGEFGLSLEFSWEIL